MVDFIRKEDETLRLGVRFLARLFGQDKPNLIDKKINWKFLKKCFFPI